MQRLYDKRKAECRGTAGDGYSIKGPFAKKNTVNIMHDQITSGLRTEQVAGFFDYGNEFRDSRKTGSFLPMKWPLASDGGLYYVHILAV